MTSSDSERALRVGFAPLSSPDARVLVLGSLPGELSLSRGEYYAQPRNAFWRIMSQLFGFPADGAYADRVAALLANRVALWDVCAAAKRVGSLDSAIASPVANEFAAFLDAHPKLDLIAFNGAKAADLYRRLVTARLPDGHVGIEQRVLPSTSPALAAMTYEQKLVRWEAVSRVARGLHSEDSDDRSNA